ncbi:hypothetical protein [Leptospira wolffii]|uniref:hypothetical protein n=1 Tax=Leptospira wolffii TaxID=409998 RepID=UPI000313E50E|nr:hypothetical protein [Leptospira wolffii]EPG67647.1 hypothetical protein LEP1GSC061_0803 [Leptospira wolffii serovar Khorat str. Khorat-H2]
MLFSFRRSLAISKDRKKPKFGFVILLSERIFWSILLAFAISNCGLALGFQAEQEASQKQDQSGTNPILAALGILSGPAYYLGFNPSIVTIVKDPISVDVTLNAWPGGESLFVEMSDSVEGGVAQIFAGESVNFTASNMIQNLSVEAFAHDDVSRPGVIVFKVASPGSIIDGQIIGVLPVVVTAAGF